MDRRGTENKILTFTIYSDFLFRAGKQNRIIRYKTILVLLPYSSSGFTNISEILSYCKLWNVWVPIPTIAVMLLGWSVPHRTLSYTPESTGIGSFPCFRMNVNCPHTIIDIHSWRIIISFPATNRPNTSSGCGGRFRVFHQHSTYIIYFNLTSLMKIYIH